MIQDAMKQLNERQQYIIQAIYFEGKSKSAVAEELGMTKSALSQALSRIMQQLKNFLQKS